MLYIAIVLCFTEQLQLFLLEEQESSTPKKSLLSVTTWVAVVTMYSIQGAKSITRSIEEVCVKSCLYVSFQSLSISVFMIRDINA